MKTQLIREESQHLIDLGVPKEKASSDKISTIEMTAYPIFELDDFLNGEILPKDLLFDNSDEDSFMEFGMIYDPILEEWHVYYACLHDKYRGVNIVKRDKELLDTLYELACWYYGEFLKSEKK